MDEVLQLFAPVIQTWFKSRVGVPTPPQVLGWPSIAAGENTLILAPTGSGKTLAAFLAAIDWVAKRLLAEPELDPAVQILYVSPLKSLANDVQKNLIVPLREMEDVAAVGGMEWPQIRIGVRSGDTPQKERAEMLRHPPHILITTPESLNLLLTSGGRRILQTVRYVIVDEVHAMAGTKRGVFLSLLLERLEEERRVAAEGGVVRGKRKIAPGVFVKVDPPMPLVRVGLSATARPAEEVGRFLAGYDNEGKPRAIALVNAGQRKRLDLEVICPWNMDDPREGEERSNWPAVSRCVLELIREHRSTLVFANSRRLVERLVGEIQGLPDAPNMLPHHGSISKEVRLDTEERLKRGELKAVVATSSLELGIDIGALDLVCQIDSPGSVAAGLQRVGRAGHLEKATAKGRMIPRQLMDLPQFAALIPLMFEGRVEETRVPQNCLDVLSQQIVASCATRTWNRFDLFRLFKRSAAYGGLPEEQFDAVVGMLSPKVDRSTAGGPRPQIGFDRVNDQLLALPSTAKLALINGGVISDTGQFAVYVMDNNVRIGELDEEFVFESRVGDRIILGSQTWSIQQIDVDRVIVSPAEPGRGRMPFWRGEGAGRSLLLGQAIGAFNRELQQRMNESENETRAWLLQERHFNDDAADAVLGLFRLQRGQGSAVPTDRTVVVEHFRDKTGEPVVAILCPLGSRVNYALRIALEAAFARERMAAQFVHNDDGILIRPGEPERMPENPLKWLSSDTLEQVIVGQLEHSALFGMRFRQAAARALMLPKINPTKRTPLWQQRLRAKGLLLLVKQQRNFPIVVETYRECLQDTLLIEQATALLREIEGGRVGVSVRQGNEPSAFARSLWMNFEMVYLYLWDDPLASAAQMPLDKGVLDAVLGRTAESTVVEEACTAADVETLDRRISGADYPARVAEELLEKLDAVGPVEIGGPGDERWRTWVVADAEGMVRELAESRRIVWITWGKQRRAVATEALGLYAAAMGKVPQVWTYREDRAGRLDLAEIPAALLTSKLTQEEAQRAVLESVLRRSALHRVEELQRELAFMRDTVVDLIEVLVKEGMALRVGGGEQVMLTIYAEQLRNIALRRERHLVKTVGLTELQAHLLRWHHMDGPREGVDALEDALDLLQGVRLPLGVWDQDVLPTRVAGYFPAMLDQLVAQGHWVPLGHTGDEISLEPRHLLYARSSVEAPQFSAAAERVLALLKTRGASFLLDMELELVDTDAGLLHALRELFFAGVVSNDRLESLRAMLLVEQTAASAPVRRAGDRSRRRRHSSGESLTTGGRWFLLPRPAVLKDATDSAQRAADRAQRALHRHGFIARELIDPEVDGRWREQYDVLTRMEWAGLVRRGYFVQGISGSQFALPEVSLEEPAGGGVIWLSQLDPANVYARVATPWVDAAGAPARVPRVEGSWLAILHGKPILAAVSFGARLIPLSAEAEEINQALAAAPALLDRLPRPLRHVLTIKQWSIGGSDHDIIGSPAETQLRSAGFSRDTQGLRLYRQYL